MENNLPRLDDMEDLGASNDLGLEELRNHGCTPAQAFAICDYEMVGELYCDEQADGTSRFFIIDFDDCNEEHEGETCEAVEILASGTIADIDLDITW